MSDTTDIAPSEHLSYATAEHVLGTGDLSRLTSKQRVEYVGLLCKSVGLNPLTRPIRFLRLGNETQAYFTRDGTDQLRRLHNITLHVVEQKVDAGVYVTRVRARLPSGREDEDIGAVTLPQAGESRANALMKCITKAKRRVTLSVVGLGFLNEDELDTMPGAVTFDAEEEPPTTTMRDYAAKVQNDAAMMALQNQQPTLREWFDAYEAAFAAPTTPKELEEVLKIYSSKPPEWMSDKPNAQRKFQSVRQAAFDRLGLGATVTQQQPDLPIEGEEKAGA